MTNTEQEILACEERITEADASHESDTSHILDELLADDVLLVGPNGQHFTKKFILDAHRPPKKQPFEKVQVTEMLIKDLGDFALVNCRGEFTLQEQAFSLRFTRVWHRANGRWRVVSGTVTKID